MISALEVRVSGDPYFINLHIPTAVLFKMFPPVGAQLKERLHKQAKLGPIEALS